MEIKKTLILDVSEPVSKAAPQLLEATAVIVTKDGKYHGIIDHQSLTQGMRDPSKVKCETVVMKPPVLLSSANVFERMGAFLDGHFKALPVVDERDKPLGITTRVELLEDMQREGLVPHVSVSELMSSPAYTISDTATIATARSIMKEKNARRLIVMSRGYPVGVVSAFDIGSWTIRPKPTEGRKNKSNRQAISYDGLSISEFLRPDITSVEKTASLEEAVERMIRKRVSAVMVVDDSKRPVGVLSALDLFKVIQEAAGQQSSIVAISGLSEDTIGMYGYIEEKIGHAVDRFRESFGIQSITVHVKEQKSTFVVSVHLDTDEGVLSMKRERGALKETIDELAMEIGNLLRKDRKSTRLNSSHYRSSRMPSSA